MQLLGLEQVQLVKVIQELGALVQVLAAHDSGVVVVRVAGKQVD